MHIGKIIPLKKWMRRFWQLTRLYENKSGFGKKDTIPVSSGGTGEGERQAGDTKEENGGPIIARAESGMEKGK